jgi:MFS family permease
MRRNLHETEAFVEAKKIAKPTGSIRGLLKYPRELLLVVGLTAGGTAAFYTFTTYMQTFVKLSVGLTEDQTTFVIFGSLLFATLLQPSYGALSDRIGRKPLLIFFGVAGTLSTVPILTTLKETKSPFVAFLLICAAWIFVAGYTSINAIVKAELFPTNVRALGVGLPYAITVSVFGGTAPAVALWFKSLGHEEWFYYYLSGMICLSLIIYSTMRDTKHHHGGRACRTNVSSLQALKASNWPLRWICRTERRLPTRCLRTALHVAKMCWRPNASRWHSQQKELRCCGSTSRASAPVKAILPTAHFRRTWSILCVPPIICAKPAKGRQS